MSESLAVPTLSVVIPVKDGERYLEELLEALAREQVEEVLAIDSGSRDRSREIIRSAGVELLEIDPAEFGHGRTRNLGAQRTGGELVCFLTQDATPVPGWAAAYRAAFALKERVGAAYGPHLPRADTSPMIARELTEFFAGFAPDPARGHRPSGRDRSGETADGEDVAHAPVVQRAGDPTFLSNVNACYARACWEEIRFREIAYSEDQAFGVDLLQAGWVKVYQPAAGVLHAHDYGALEFMRRYFDEYRGLHESTGHVEPFGVLATARQVRAEVAGDRRWAKAQGLGGAARARLTARSAVHHGGRRVFSALGSRAERLPAPVRGRLSLEGRDDRVKGQGPAGSSAGGSSAHGHAPDGSADSTSGLAPGATPSVSPVPPTTHMPPKRDHDDYDDVARFWREGAAPLLDPVPGMADRERLRIAMLLPHFRRGSGGHTILMQLLLDLERRGHVCSVYVQNTMNMHESDWPGVLRHNLRDF
ncbi:MAG TPA: glycosyltransferase family 2 protein, partial [Solirubrobacteraceae bacterium]